MSNYFKDTFGFKYKLFHSGTMIAASNHLVDLFKIIKEMEKQDIEDGVYSPNSYKIKCYVEPVSVE